MMQLHYWSNNYERVSHKIKVEIALLPVINMTHFRPSLYSLGLLLSLSLSTSFSVWRKFKQIQYKVSNFRDEGQCVCDGVSLSDRQSQLLRISICAVVEAGTISLFGYVLILSRSEADSLGINTAKYSLNQRFQVSCIAENFPMNSDLWGISKYWNASSISCSPCSSLLILLMSHHPSSRSEGSANNLRRPIQSIYVGLRSSITACPLPSHRKLST